MLPICSTPYYGSIAASSTTTLCSVRACTLRMPCYHMYHPLPCLCNASTLRRARQCMSCMRRYTWLPHVQVHECPQLTRAKYLLRKQGKRFASFVCLAPRVFLFSAPRGAQPLGGLALQGHPPLQSKGFAPPFGPGFASFCPSGGLSMLGIATFGVEAQVGKRARARVLGKTAPQASKKGTCATYKGYPPPQRGCFEDLGPPRSPKWSPLHRVDGSSGSDGTNHSLSWPSVPTLLPLRSLYFIGKREVGATPHGTNTMPPLVPLHGPKGAPSQPPMVWS